MKSDLIICISREFGSGGHEIGTLLSQKLGIELIDKQIVEEAASLGKIDESYFKDGGESSSNNFIFSNIGGHSITFDDSSSVITSQKLFYLQSAAIKKIAKENSCGIFVGRCADIILRDFPNCHTFFIHSPLKERIKRIMKIKGISEKEAESLIKKTDKERASYHNYYTKTKWGHPTNYEMILNSSKIGVSKVADIISLYINMEV